MIKLSLFDLACSCNVYWVNAGATVQSSLRYEATRCAHEIATTRHSFRISQEAAHWGKCSSMQYSYMRSSAVMEP